ncbi:MAG: ABC transporter substrate-binding protein [Candidatus Syntropharchaeia archaeon]
MKAETIILIGMVLISLGCGCISQEKTVDMKIGILPDRMALPIVVADEEGLYGDMNVEVVPFMSALERDAALSAGEIDACLNDPIGTISLKQGGTDVVVVMSMVLCESGERQFSIVSAPDSGIESVSDLKGKKLAISRGTIIEYVTDAMLERKGVEAENVEMVEVKKMPVRLQMVLEGDVDAATLPEPLSSYVVVKGGRIVASDENLSEVSHTFVIFRKGFVEKHRGLVEKFVEGYTKGVDAINSNPEKYREIFVETVKIPKEIADTYDIPIFPHPEPYRKSYYEKAAEWMKEKGYLSEEVPFEEIVDNSFVHDQD